MIPELLIKTSVDNLYANKSKVVLRENLNRDEVFDFRELGFGLFDGFIDVDIDTRGTIQSYYADYVSPIDFREVALDKYRIRFRPTVDVTDEISYVKYIRRDVTDIDTGKIKLISSYYPKVIKPKVYRLVRDVSVNTIPNDEEYHPIVSFSPPSRDYYVSLIYFKYDVSDKSIFFYVSRDKDVDYLKINTYVIQSSSVFLPANSSITVNMINKSTTTVDIKVELAFAIIRKTAIDKWLLGDYLTSEDKAFLASNKIEELYRKGLIKYDVENIELW